MTIPDPDGPRAPTGASGKDGPSGEPIHVTQAILPPRDIYARYLEEVFTSRHLTNEGRFVRQLEKALAERFHTPYLSLCTNGTLSLQLAIRLKNLQGKEVVTTPFTYVATASALLWEGCTPVFADIDEETLCLSPEKAAAAVTGNTAAVMPVHIYGNACDVEAFADVCRNHGLACIYDAAQAVGCDYKGESLLRHGDVAVCSFHATKVFHTVEGGAVVTRSREDHERLSLLRAFGHKGDEHYTLGVNAKLSELHAVMGLALLPEFEANIRARERVSQVYDAHLPLPGLRRPALRPGLAYNFAYYPVIFDDPGRRERVVAALNAAGVFPRRYFFPAVNTLPYMPKAASCPVAERMALRALCLPLYADLADDDVARIVACIRRTA